MQFSERFLITVLILHAFIIAAGGHGVIFAGLTAIFIPDLIVQLQSGGPVLDPVPGLGLLGILSLIGYTLLITSAFCDKKQRKLIYWIAVSTLSISLFWLIALDYYSDLISPKILYFPFLLTSVYPVYRKFIKRFERWLLK